MLDFLWLIPALPLLSAFVLGVVGWRLSKRVICTLGVGSVGLSFAASLGMAWAFFQLAPEQIPIRSSYFTWLAAGNFQVEVGFYLDQLSLLMVLVVTGVGWLIDRKSVV